MMMKLFPRTQIDQILQELTQRDTKINLVDYFYQTTKEKKGVNNFDFERLETNKIFHLNQIKKVCIDYRLRFLDLKYFKGNIPKEGIEKITQLEKDHETSLEGFKIMAPSVLFRLKKNRRPTIICSPW